MSEDVADLRRRVEELESELQASLRREYLLQHRDESGGWKERFKRTALGKRAADPNSLFGKVVRFPRTVFRIMRHPSIVKEIMARKSGETISLQEEEMVEKKDVGVPIKFFLSEDKTERVNLVMNHLGIEELKMAIEMANRQKDELRVITRAESAGVTKYRKWLEQKKVPKAERVSFYSSYDQARKKEVLELEVGEGDAFIIKAWNDGAK